MNHFTDKVGFNAIRSQPTWTFKASKPQAPQNPIGAYFTDYPPNEPLLSVRIFVPKEKLEFMFAFENVGDLRLLVGNRGRNKRIFYSPHDYPVVRDRQRYHGPSGEFPAGEGATKEP